jgi:hypothetical protein
MNVFFSFLPRFCLLASLFATLSAAGAARAFTADHAYLADRANLDALQRDCFRYMWEEGDPATGMAYEANFNWDVRPLAVGGTGFGIAAVVVAVDRGWITRDQALFRLMKITRFLRDRTQRAELHGAFPHWLNGNTGRSMSFDQRDAGADIVETALLMQGLLIARAYFNGPGKEGELRRIITELWEDVDWNWFTDNEENGVHWHWSPEHGYSGLKILGYNECLITYLLAISSPTRPISRKAYDYWTSGKGYQPKNNFGYTIEASLANAGPLFLTHYSFIGPDPRRMADAYVPRGYFLRNVAHVLSNRAYCLWNAPARNKYSEQAWGLTASQIKGGYAAADPAHDSGVIGPTGALSSMPYTPHYSLQFLGYLGSVSADGKAGAPAGVWGPCGPFDGFSLRDNWISDRYLAIDQLPIVCMVENYRSGLLWDVFMRDKDVLAGMRKAGISEPDLESGFPEAVVTLKKKGRNAYEPDACDIRRHPDSGLYAVPYRTAQPGKTRFTLKDTSGNVLLEREEDAAKGRNTLLFPQFAPPDGAVLVLDMRTEDGGEYSLPLRLH